MPIFEYLCRSCGSNFETIVMGNEKVECPACHGSEVAKKLSTFAVGSSAARSQPVAPCGRAGGCHGGCGMMPE